MNELSRLLRLRDVVTRTGLSRSSIYRLVALGDFPAPVKLTRHASAFREREISEWIEARPVSVRAPGARVD